jgi:hypothetical protein
MKYTLGTAYRRVRYLVRPTTSLVQTIPSP